MWPTPSTRVLAMCFAAWFVVSVFADPIESSNHWAFRPVKPPAIPESGGNPLDYLVSHKLTERGLKFSQPADKRTLIRRATQDLTGLPPSPEEIAAFVADKSTNAFSNLVDRLLESPRYGERWGRHWMDVVRYADTAGDNADYPIPEARLYRDYIIDSFNADKPFDHFVREQLAGDILAKGRSGNDYAEQVTATGFLALSRRYGTGPYELWHLTLENTIETVGQAFLGLNLRCARCHDHKFDPVTMSDYYGLYGIFESTQFPWAGSEEVQSKGFNRQKFVALMPEAEAKPKMDEWEAQIKTLREQIEKLEKDKPAEKTAREERDKEIAKSKKELRNLEKPGVPEDLPVAYGVREGKPVDATLQRQGEPGKSGPVTPRCAPAFLTHHAQLGIPAGSSGRLEFANWLTAAENPLCARVMVNRVWQHHFGEGLVRTPNNFGLRGDSPVHAELLDYLAARFVESEWSVKAIHRLIMNSRTYQQSSDGGANGETIDPANRYFWRFDQRRLDAEQIRDAILFASGNLDTNRPGVHPFPPPEKWTWTQHAPFKEVYASNHRSVYLMTQRFQKHPFLGLFDGPDTNSSTESRRTSTVPQQALFALNNPWFDEQAHALARRMLRERVEEQERVHRMYELLFGRSPSKAEIEKTHQWIVRAVKIAEEENTPSNRREEKAWTSLSRSMLSANEFFYVD